MYKHVHIVFLIVVSIILLCNKCYCKKIFQDKTQIPEKPHHKQRESIKHWSWKERREQSESGNKTCITLNTSGISLTPKNNSKGKTRITIPSESVLRMETECNNNPKVMELYIPTSQSSLKFHFFVENEHHYSLVLVEFVLARNETEKAYMGG